MSDLPGEITKYVISISYFVVGKIGMCFALLLGNNDALATAA
jgi:hypothetical protein